jgi:F-type H+-transporting ATPase subunit b
LKQRELAQARARAQKTAADAKAAAKAEADTRNAAEEAKLHERLAAAEAGIQAGREKAMSNVRNLAAETAEAIVEKLSGQAPTRAEVDAAIARNAA